MGYLLALGLQLECGLRAVNGMIVLSAVQQRLAEPAKKQREFVLPNRVLGEITLARLDEIRAAAQRQSAPDRCFVNFIQFLHCARPGSNVTRQ